MIMLVVLIMKVPLTAYAVKDILEMEFQVVQVCLKHDQNAIFLTLFIHKELSFFFWR